MSERKAPTRGNMGKWAEGEVQDWLDLKSKETTDFAYHRYPDARAARGALAAQPADFLISHLDQSYQRPKVTHLEVKDTEQLYRLPKSKIGQYGMLLKFHLTGMNTLVLVYRSEHKDWAMFNGHDLFDHQGETPKSFPFFPPYFSTAAEALRSVFK